MEDNDEIKSKVKRMQDIIYRMICDIDDFCAKNNIRYYLSGGTCLGAVRHHGFIPWDDDADLMMPRNDYERFLTEFPSQHSEKYGVESLSIDKSWTRPYSRVWDKKTRMRTTNLNEKEIGVFLDLFPIDGLPESKIGRKVYYKYTKILQKLNTACLKKEFLPNEGFRAIKSIMKACLRESWAPWFVKKMESEAQKYDFDKATYVAVSMATQYGERETIKRELMSSETRLQFVDRKLPVPVGYDTYLSNLYGDYMTIPEGAKENGYSHLSHWKIEFLDD